MTKDRAREFFSAYYEGDLEPGLKQSLEQALQRDRELADDYRQFTSTYESLGQLKFEAIEIPFDLQDRILARVDRHLLEQKQAAQPVWIIWLRNLAATGVAAAVLIGGLLTYSKRGEGVTQANLIGTPNSRDDIGVTYAAGEVKITFTPDEPETVVIEDAETGEQLRSVPVDRRSKLESSLRNDNAADSAAFKVSVVGEATRIFVAIPGADIESAGSASGTLLDFAQALAGRFRVPVTLRVQNEKLPVEWDLSEAKTVEEAASSTLPSGSYSLELRPSGMLVISED